MDRRFRLLEGLHRTVIADVFVDYNSVRRRGRQNDAAESPSTVALPSASFDKECRSLGVYFPDLRVKAHIYRRCRVGSASSACSRPGKYYAIGDAKFTCVSRRRCSRDRDLLLDSASGLRSDAASAGPRSRPCGGSRGDRISSGPAQAPTARAVFPYRGRWKCAGWFRDRTLHGGLFFAAACITSPASSADQLR